jgi:hypothetical protein
MVFLGGAAQHRIQARAFAHHQQMMVRRRDHHRSCDQFVAVARERHWQAERRCSKSGNALGRSADVHGHQDGCGQIGRQVTQQHAQGMQSAGGSTDHDHSVHHMLLRDG